jgi:hypothetical protein
MESSRADQLRAFGIEPGTWAEHCANTYHVDELISMLEESNPGPEEVLTSWNLNPAQWRQGLAQALRCNLCFDERPNPAPPAAPRSPLKLVK